MRCLRYSPNNAAAATGPGDFDFSRMTTVTRERSMANGDGFESEIPRVIGFNDPRDSTCHLSQRR